MKKTFVLFKLLFLIPFLFAPILKVDQNTIISLLGNTTNNWFTILLILEALLLLVCFIFVSIKRAKILSIIASFSLFICFVFNRFISLNFFTTSIIQPGFLFLIFISIYLFIKSLINFNSSLKFNVKDLIEIGIFVGIAIALDALNLKIKIGANGGSISFSMVPLIILCLRKGFVKGFVACGIVFGIINCLIDGYGIVCYPLDYLLAFGSMAVVGLFRKTIINKDYRLKIKSIIFLIFSILIACLLRLVFATISGMIIWNLNLLSSFTYQILYIGPSFVVTCLICCLLLKPFLFIEKKYKS